jgi:hypothetical protein
MLSPVYIYQLTNFLHFKILLITSNALFRFFLLSVDHIYMSDGKEIKWVQIVRKERVIYPISIHQYGLFMTFKD